MHIEFPKNNGESKTKKHYPTLPTKIIVQSRIVAASTLRSLNTVDNENWIYSILLMSQLPTQPQLSRISIVPS